MISYVVDLLYTKLDAFLVLMGSNGLGVHEDYKVMFSLFSMTHLGNAKYVVLLRCRFLVNMTNILKLSYYRGNAKR